MKKRFFVLAAALLLLFTLPATARVAFDYDSIDPSVKVHDLAGLFSAEETAALEARIDALAATWQTDIVVATVDENPDTAQQLADDLFDYGGFGFGAEYDGVLLLIDMDNREVAISTCGQTKYAIRQSRIDPMLDVIAPRLTAGDYAGAAEAFLDEVDAELAYTASAGIGGGATDWLWPAVLIAFLVAAGITAIRMVLLYRRHRPVRPATEAASYAVPNSFVVTARQDVFLRTHTTRTRIQSDNSSSGGFHSGSSGRSHGGGSRRF